MAERLVVLDTETTGISISDGHRILEVGCIEIIARRRTRRDFYMRTNPGRPIDPEATKVHGIRDADVENEPHFSAIADALIAYVRGATLIIHNAQFDLSFLDMEIEKAGLQVKLREICKVVDTLTLALARHPQQKNTLDALCHRYGIDTSKRATAHGALIDAELLADLYLAMTTVQSRMDLGSSSVASTRRLSRLAELLSAKEENLMVIRASPGEIRLHEEKLQAIHKVHLKALERKVEDLKTEVRKIIERISIIKNENQVSSSSESPSCACEALEHLDKLHDVLLKKESELSSTETKLIKVRREGVLKF